MMAFSLLTSATVGPRVLGLSSSNCLLTEAGSIFAPVTSMKFFCE